MKKPTRCPDCKSALMPGAKECACGWKDDSAPAAAGRSHHCAAYGCELLGTIAPESGSRWYCRYHANGTPPINDIITRVLKTNRRAVEFHTRLLRTSIMDFHLQRKRFEAEKFPPLPDETLDKYQNRVAQWINCKIQEAINAALSNGRQKSLIDGLNNKPDGMAHVSHHSPREVRDAEELMP